MIESTRELIMIIGTIIKIFEYIVIILGLIIAIYLCYLFVGIVTTLYIRYKNPLKRIDRNNKVLYLTFDDGCNKQYTPILLDILKKYNIHATFFIMACTIYKNEEIIKRMKEEGHIVAYHSFNHKNQILQLPCQIKRDFNISMNYFDEINYDVMYYRPPWGHIRLYGLYLCKKIDLKIVFWNVIVQDWEKNTSSDIIMKKLINKVKGNSVICLHDGRGKNDAPLKTIKALDILLPKWKSEGYTFETVDKMDKKNIM